MRISMIRNHGLVLGLDKEILQLAMYFTSGNFYHLEIGQALFLNLALNI